MKLLSQIKRISSANKNSATLPVTVPAVQPSEKESESPEIYKVITEEKFPTNRESNSEAASVEMVKEEHVLPDGADEEMLGTGGAEEKLAEPRDEVKFIKGDHQNGEAKIDIGNLNNEKPAFTGMSKEELMKYANDPFWVRLRWICFVGFWAIWVGMLVGAILIIIGAPKCAAPQPLSWWKRGPHAKFGNVGTCQASDVQSAEKLSASGVIYELPAQNTYEVTKPAVEAQIKQLVDIYKNSKIKIILDLTPNFATKESQLVQDALASEEKRSAFFWKSAGPELPNNWKKVGGNSSAWETVEGSYVLSQFQPGTYDLRMNSTIVRQEFGGVLKHLLGLGINGFRLKNTKFFLINDNLDNEDIALSPNYNMVDYGFYTHTKSTFQSGLGDVLYDYLGIVKNASADAFLSVAEDIIRPDAYKLSKPADAFGIDLLLLGDFIKTLSASKPSKNLKQELEQTLIVTSNSSWLQWNLADVYVDTVADPSALALFVSLLPGVPIVPVDSIEFSGVAKETYTEIQTLRTSHSFMHGSVNVYEINHLISYTRLKSGSPGYFVVYNPTELPQRSNFTVAAHLPEKMTVFYLSEKYAEQSVNATNIAKSNKVNLSELKIAPHSTVVFTYVPKTD